MGATLVGGTLADIWPASERGGKMAVFALMAVSGTAFAPVIFSWVEANPRLEWRWIQWIQIILVGVYLPSIPLFMPETRAAVLLKKQARKMRRRKDKVEDEVQREQGGGVEEKGKWDDGMKYLARGEVGKPKFGELMRVSLIRPIRESSTTSSPSFHAVRVTNECMCRAQTSWRRNRSSSSSPSGSRSPGPSCTVSSSPYLTCSRTCTGSGRGGSGWSTWL